MHLFTAYRDFVDHILIIQLLSIKTHCYLQVPDEIFWGIDSLITAVSVHLIVLKPFLKTFGQKFSDVTDKNLLPKLQALSNHLFYLFLSSM